MTSSFTELFFGKSVLRLLFPARYPSKLQSLTAPAEVQGVVGAAMFIRRDTIEKVGGIDERFFIFLEETDWCRRVRKAGYKIYLHPDAKLVHHQGQTVNRAHVRKRIEYTHSLFLYWKKNHPRQYPWLRILFPFKNGMEVLFSCLGLLFTLGLNRRARRRFVEKFGCLWWQIRGCPRDAGLRPADLQIPPGREHLAPREA